MVPYNPYDHFVPEAPKFVLTSDDVADGKPLPPAQLSKIYGVVGGEDKSPSLAWTGFSKDTKSFVATCYDPDAPVVSGFWHWIVYDIPADVTSLPAGAGEKDDTSKLPKGCKVLNNDAGFPGYLGAAAPPGHGPHRYIFAIFAIGEQTLELDETASPAMCHSKMRRTGVVGQAYIAPTFER